MGIGGSLWVFLIHVLISRVTIFGTSAKYIQSLLDAKVFPGMSIQVKIRGYV